jgi:phosphoribosylformimino-5-aminoimidazole carboxamide ribotide isomerase
LAAGAERVIVGSETLPDLGALRALQDQLPAQRRLFSLDLAGGQVLSRAPALKGRVPMDVLDLLVREGWSQVIVLTLDRVGTGSGLDWALLRAIRRAYPTLKLIAGGGVQSLDEVRRLEALGVDGVLVASALHRGWITRAGLFDLPACEQVRKRL